MRASALLPNAVSLDDNCCASGSCSGLSSRITRYQSHRCIGASIADAPTRAHSRYFLRYTTRSVHCYITGVIMFIRAVDSPPLSPDPLRPAIKFCFLPTDLSTRYFHQLCTASQTETQRYHRAVARLYVVYIHRRTEAVIPNVITQHNYFIYKAFN